MSTTPPPVQPATIEAEPDHLTKEKPKQSPSDLSTSNSREYWCLDCRKRVTQGERGEREYGHGPKCEHAISNSPES